MPHTCDWNHPASIRVCFENAQETMELRAVQQESHRRLGPCVMLWRCMVFTIPPTTTKSTSHSSLSSAKVHQSRLCNCILTTMVLQQCALCVCASMRQNLNSSFQADVQESSILKSTLQDMMHFRHHTALLHV